MMRETLTSEELLRFQLSLLRLVTREEPTRPAQPATVASHTCQLEALVSNLRLGQQ
jgi:hypothetical protein